MRPFLWQAPQDTQSATGLAWKNGSRRQGPAPRMGAAPRVAPVKWCSKSWDVGQVGENRQISNRLIKTPKNEHSEHIPASGEFILSILFDIFKCKMTTIFSLQDVSASVPKCEKYSLSHQQAFEFLGPSSRASQILKRVENMTPRDTYLRYLHPNSKPAMNLTTPHLAELLTGKTSRIPDSLHWKTCT